MFHNLIFCMCSVTDTSNVSTDVNTFASTIATAAMSTPLITARMPSSGTLPPAVGRIMVIWKDANSCQGTIHFDSFNLKHKMLLCYNSSITNYNLGIELCMQRRCGNLRRIMIHENQPASNSPKSKKAFFICEGVYVCLFVCVTCNEITE